MANAITSKEFNSKKTAQAAARRVYGAEYATLVTIDELDEKWYVSELAAKPVEETVAETTVEPATNAEPSDATRRAFKAERVVQLAAEHLVGQGVTEVVVANRTLQRAVNLARCYNGQAVSLEELLDQLHLVDIIISSTGAPDLILHREDVRSVMRGRRNRPRRRPRAGARRVPARVRRGRRRGRR